jgi:hypothetical protein
MTDDSVNVDRSGRWMFWLCAAVALIPLWTVKYLPMIDLPQHAAQLSIWRHLHDPAYGFAGQFELFWSEPYLLGYLLAMALTPIVSVATAVKIVLSVYIVGFPWSMEQLLAQAGGDRRWALMGFPLAFGYAFGWGFFPYLAAMPLALLLVAMAFRYARCPSWPTALVLAAMGCLLYVAHLLVLGIGTAAAGLVILARSIPAVGVRRALLRLAPLAVPWPAVVAWMCWMRAHYAQTRSATVWAIGLERPAWFPSVLLGQAGDLEAGLMAILLVAAIALARPRPSRDPARWLPAVVLLALYLAAPLVAFGTFYVYPRFAVFAFVFALAAFDAPRDAARARLSGLLLLGGALIWLAVLGVRHRAFDEEARTFDAVMQRMEPNRRAVALTFDPTSRWVKGVPYLHFLAWYQVEKGGVLGFSFASFSGMMARYRPGAEPPMTAGLEWYPGRFSWERDGGFDYYVVRAPVDIGPELARGAAAPLRLEVRSGPWWLFHKLGGEGSGQQAVR